MATKNACSRSVRISDYEIMKIGIKLATLNQPTLPAPPRPLPARAVSVDALSMSDRDVDSPLCMLTLTRQTSHHHRQTDI